MGVLPVAGLRQKLREYGSFASVGFFPLGDRLGWVGAPKTTEEALMADATVKRVDEMESIFDGSFVRARAALGARSFGMNIINLPANWENYPEHDHVGPPSTTCRRRSTPR